MRNKPPPRHPDWSEAEESVESVESVESGGKRWKAEESVESGGKRRDLRFLPVLICFLGKTQIPPLLFAPVPAPDFSPGKSVGTKNIGLQPWWSGSRSR